MKTHVTVNVDKTIEIIGLSSIPMITLETIHLPVHPKVEIKFHVIPQIPGGYGAILGDNMLNQLKAHISFHSNIRFNVVPLALIHFCLSNRSTSEKHCRFALSGGGPRINLRVKNLNGGKHRFLIDTGVNINLIERSVLKPEVKIDVPRIPFLLGITEYALPTCGLVHL